MDFIIDELIGAWYSPIDLALRFMILVLAFDSVFGLIGNLISTLRFKNKI